MNMLMKRHNHHSLRILLLAILMACTSLSFSSCGNDEPDLLVGYYLSIQSQVRLNLTEKDESQGTSSAPVADMLSSTIVRMREALRNTYPTLNYQGNDAMVIAACDHIYMEYKSMYGANERNTVCIVKLYRTGMDGETVKNSKALKTYHFGAIPEQEDQTSL